MIIILVGFFGVFGRIYRFVICSYENSKCLVFLEFKGWFDNYNNLRMEE